VPVAESKGMVVAGIVLGIAFAVPAAVAWLIVIVRDNGRRLAHAVGRKSGKRWAQ
jgi:uncharacterized protein (DUF2062 family)